MAHYSQQKFVSICFDNLKTNNENFKNFDVLDVGSLDINGSIKKLLNGNNYIGTDLTSGPNVDHVIGGDNLESLNRKFNLVITCEVFEHAENWDKIFQSMYNVTKEDGLIIFTCASKGRIEHGTLRTNPESIITDTYYLNLEKKDFDKKFNIKDMFSNYFFFYNYYSQDLYFIGGKKLKKTKIDFDEIKRKTREIKNEKKKILLKRLIYSSIMSDKQYQNFRFLRRNFTNFIKKFFHN